jgi:hypothetical protein
MMKTKMEIEAEINALVPLATAYDTISQSVVSCVAAGAHDALRWALGLAETPLSEGLTAE